MNGLVAFSLLAFLGSIFAVAGLLAREDEKEGRGAQGVHCLTVGLGIILFAAGSLINWALS